MAHRRLGFAKQNRAGGFCFFDSASVVDCRLGSDRLSTKASSIWTYLTAVGENLIHKGLVYCVQIGSSVSLVFKRSRYHVGQSESTLQPTLHFNNI
jgi:hypothetical protein